MAKNTIESSQEIYQIKVTLLGTRPAIWRRLLVPDCPLMDFHDVLQAAMSGRIATCMSSAPAIGDLAFPIRWTESSAVALAW